MSHAERTHMLLLSPCSSPTSVMVLLSNFTETFLKGAGREMGLCQGEQPSLFKDAWPKVPSPLPAWAHLAGALPVLWGHARRDKAGAHKLLSTASEQPSQVSSKHHHIGADRHGLMPSPSALSIGRRARTPGATGARRAALQQSGATELNPCVFLL